MVELMAIWFCLIGILSLAGCSRQTAQQATGQPEQSLESRFGQVGPTDQDPYFPVHFSFLENGKPTPVRVYMQLNNQAYLIDSLGYRLSIHGDAHYHDRIFPLKPSIPVLDMIEGDEHHWYFLTGEAVLPMLPGRYEIAVYKGLEFVPLHKSFELIGQEREKTFSLERWYDGPAEGWYSGDDHIHLTRHQSDDWIFLSMMEAEDLAVGHFLQLQRREQLAVQYAWGDEGEADRDGYIIRPGEEQRSTFYGHTLLLGIDSLVRPVSLGLELGLSPYAEPLTTDLFNTARRLNGLAGYAHDSGMGDRTAATIDLVFGDIDFIEVFQFSKVTAEFWYLALSCGYRVPGTAGSDFPVNLGRTNPWTKLIPAFGPDRMYIQVEGALKFDNWMDGIEKGNILLTNGPIVYFAVNGTLPGGEVRLPTGTREVEISATIKHWRPMREARLLVNGRVQKKYSGAGSKVWEIKDRISLPSSAWLALHTLSDSTGLDDEGVLIQAHTNPVYVVVDERPIGDPEALRTMIRRLEGTRDFYASDSLVFRNEAYRERLLNRTAKAMAEYERRLAEARD
ncbi:MAG: CehA/McbA family metallohydrolase [Candidatus Glassbacteria bacterium]